MPSERMLLLVAAVIALGAVTISIAYWFSQSFAATLVAPALGVVIIFAMLARVLFGRRN